MASNESRRVSQQQLAELAGVSRATVTRALSNDPRISQEVTRRIQKLAQEYGYRLNAAARSIATRRSNAIGIVLCDRQLTHANYGTLVGGVESAARAAGVRLQLSLCDTGESRESRVPPIFEQMDVDGVVLTGAVPDWLLDQLEKWRTPTVLLGSQPGRANVSQVLGDPEMAGSLIARHVIGLGHRKIGLLIGPRAKTPHSGYLSGFLRGVADLGLATQAIEQSIAEAGTPDVIEPLNQLLTSQPGLTAICCGTDMAAWHTVQYLRALGRDVPGQISVTGVGGRLKDYNIPLQITTVDVGLEVMARAAVDLLLESIAQPDQPARRVLVQPRVITGTTTAAAGDAG